MNNCPASSRHNHGVVARRRIRPGHNTSTEPTVPPGDGVIGLGVNFQVTRPGKPDRVRLTGELKFPTEVTVTVRLPHVPWLMITGLGVAVIVKSLGGVDITSPTETLCVMRGRVELPVMVRL